MTTKKLIVIIGATGGQGGSVVNSFLNDPEWRVRGITRNPSSQKSKNLEARGVQVVQANLDDRASLAKVFQDANVIFAVSDFWGIYNDPNNRNKPRQGQALNEDKGTRNPTTQEYHRRSCQSIKSRTFHHIFTSGPDEIIKRKVHKCLSSRLQGRCRRVW